jgi:ribosomal protein S18 acetylase RimI-like enzyme
MTDPSVEIRSATREELHQTVSCIVAAFITDPMARFACPAPHDYLRGMPVMVREFTSASFDHASAYVCADFSGAALWLPPGVQPDDEKLERAFREHTAPDRLDDVLGTFEQMGQAHPDEPHWYLPMIGVEPNAQNRGFGAALMRHALARCDRERSVAYLESSNPRNIPFYERHGFAVLGQIQVGAAPVITPMSRRPR